MAAQDASRVDPTLQFLLANRHRIDVSDSARYFPGPRAGQAPALTRPRQLGPGGVGGAIVPNLLTAALQDAPDGPRVRVLVRLGPGGAAALRRAGAEIGTRAGDIVTARVPLEAVSTLLADPAVRVMEASTALRPLSLVPADSSAPPSAPDRPTGVANDSAMDDADFSRLRRRVGERWEGLAGQGVIVGVYDSGLDLDHEDFLAPDGSTRVLFAWDQTGSGGGPGAVGQQSFTYGTECSAAEIDAGDCAMVDRVGHGTHVAGTLAGDGSATGNGMPAFRFQGGAPAADLIVVKGGDGVYTADRLVDGVAYIFERAAELGRPAVVNLSLSSQSGPHDGTTLLEEALDALSGPGRIVVSGAGNAGNHQNTFPPVHNGWWHAEGTAGGPAHGLVIPPYHPAPGDANDAVLLEIWYDGSDSVAITVTSPRGDAVTAVTGDSASMASPGGAVAIVNALDGPAPANGDHSAIIGLLDFEASAPPDTGVWSIDVDPVAIHGTGEYHVWLVGAALFLQGGVVSLQGGTTNRYLVGIPASADRVLAAGAHVTRHEWLALGRDPETFPIREELGDIAYFSSPGPRRDGVQKPELTAPGKVLMSSLSSNATLWTGVPWLIEADSVHVGLLGTSMAAPQVAAAVALLLQVEPDLAPERAEEMLRLGATTDAFVPARLPDPVWGAGKLSAAGAMERLRPDGLAPGEEAVTLSANPVRSDALVIGYAEPPRSVAVYTLAAERVRSFDPSEIGPLTTVWPLDTDQGGDVANGVYVLVVELPDRRVLEKIFVARP